MASIRIIQEQGVLADIDYSLVDRRIKYFKYKDKILYDEDNNISVDGWKDKLWQLVLDHGYDIDDGKGLHAFVYPLIDEYNSRPSKDVTD